jgi:hypothetical protein
MKDEDKKNVTKFYLTIGLITVILVSAWVLNFKKQLADTPNTNSNPTLRAEWDKMTTDLSTVIDGLKEFTGSTVQSPTSTATELQQAAEFSPEQLDSLIDQLNISTTTTSTIKILQ